MSTPAFRSPRLDYESLAERYTTAVVGEVIEVAQVDTDRRGRSKQAGVIRFLRGKGLEAQRDFQTALHKNTVYLKKLSNQEVSDV